MCNLIGGINQFLMGDLTLVTVYLDRNEPSGTFQMDFSDESQCLVVTERHGRDHLMRTLSLDTEEEVAVLPNLSPCSLRASKVSLKSTVSQRATKVSLKSTVSQRATKVSLESTVSQRATKVSLESTISLRASKEILESNFPLNFYGNRGDVAGSSLR